jgi:hypothetical protein
MLKLILAFCTLTLFPIAEAQTFKVVKIQGRKAIVELNDPSAVNLNQTYNVGSSSSGPTSFKRDNGIAANFSYSSRNSVTDIQLGGTYLWNLKQYEFGPLVQLQNTSAGGVSTNITTFGGTGFYNFNENKVGVETVLSAVGALSLSSGGGVSTTNINLGGNYRWFLLSGDHCFSFSGLYKMVQASGANTSGFALEAGIATYF